MKLSQVQKGRSYTIKRFEGLNSLAKRLAILGLNTGAVIQLTALYHHGALIKTNVGDVAIGRDLLDQIRVTLESEVFANI